MRVTNAEVKFSGEAEVWDFDLANREKFKALAGSQFLSADGETFRYRSQEGLEYTGNSGWAVVRLDGNEDEQVIFMSQNTLATFLRPVTVQQ